MYDVVALGEVLIDFLPINNNLNNNPTFEANPGGAPANVLVALTKLGKSTSFIGKVGEDQFGLFLKNTLDSSGIDTKGLVFSKEVNTTLAFVHLDNSGDRSFSFYRKPGADMMLRSDEIDFGIIDNCKIFHFGSLSMTDEPSKSATLRAIEYAKSKGKIISYDPNLREPLWPNLEKAKDTILSVMSKADIVKLSAEELLFLTGEDDLEIGSNILINKYKNKTILVTRGAEGCFFNTGRYLGEVPTYKVKAIDTTGSGDAFLGAFLYKVLEKNKEIEDLTQDEFKEIIKFSNAAGTLVATRNGAIPAMGLVEEINEATLNI